MRPHSGISASGARGRSRGISESLAPLQDKGTPPCPGAAREASGQETAYQQHCHRKGEHAEQQAPEEARIDPVDDVHAGHNAQDAEEGAEKGGLEQGRGLEAGVRMSVV